jgi:hypothetical protein
MDFAGKPTDYRNRWHKESESRCEDLWIGAAPGRCRIMSFPRFAGGVALGFDTLRRAENKAL